MPRKHRLEFPGACYHVINRGNYRTNIFRTEGAKLAFEACLFEACETYRWRLHAFVVMRNHYHLALETPEGNLVTGMQWLQATFANRFNKLRSEHGHVFQGRYKALVVERAGALGQVCDYIHLNPVRAGVCTVEGLEGLRFGSYWYLQRPTRRREFMVLETALVEAGELADTPTGRRCYLDYLTWQVAVGPAGKSKAYTNMSKGWALGTDRFKAALLESPDVPDSPRAWGIVGAREVRNQRQQDMRARCLNALRKNEENVRNDPKSAGWKVAIARFLKEREQADNRWLGDSLSMGRPEAVSTYVGRMKRGEIDDSVYRLLKTTNV
ncbi:transposase [Synoicihabitans lomoniglobus]|uniref:Transposase n=1 Tax=Synoicihabitans lomoniglobus TaxID=2909285 RepID=A0AAF0CMJ9_9BACT|nr:transposase [Opitutaceae bacterium LMO-M01]WED63140.1 transposase [Opitutaceae bacterium LMO-M01]